MNDSLIEEIKSIPGVTDVMTREIVSVNLNGTRFPAAIVSKKDFDFMRQDGDIGAMDYDQAVLLMLTSHRDSGRSLPPAHVPLPPFHSMLPLCLQM